MLGWINIQITDQIKKLGYIITNLVSFNNKAHGRDLAAAIAHQLVYTSTPKGCSHATC